MLKGKKTLYILIPLNVLIWGFFIYRFIETFNDSDMPDIGEKHSVVKISGLNDSIAYTLSMNYKDPFLKDAERSKDHYVQKTVEQKTSVKVSPTPVKTPSVAPKQIPDIRYLGLVKNSSSGAATAIISLNGQSKVIKANEVVEGVIFKSFNKDSLVAKWGKEKLIVRK